MSDFAKVMEGVRLQWKKSRVNGFRFRERDTTKLSVPWQLLSHPLRTFDEIKFENRGSMLLANCLLVLFFWVNLLDATLTGYLFNAYPVKELNILSVLAYSVGLVILWTVCNWATCTLIEGEGKMRDIWIMTIYSLLPYILLNAASILLSNFFSLDESVLYSAIRTVYTGWSVLLVFLGMLTAHQFTVKKTIVSVLITLLSMLAVCFLLLLFFSIAQQFTGFLISIVKELSYRGESF